VKTPPAIKKSGGVNSIQQRPIFIRARDGKKWNLQWSTLWASSLNMQTSIAKEDLYKDGVASANYQGFNRDETYPLGVRFKTATGQQDSLL
jgi:hypothetical protein